MAELYVGLVHYPIYNKRMDVIASAVTNFDIHDIARTCRTYDVKQYYLIHPKEAQKQMIHKILHYWQEGYGKVYNPDRADALERVHWLEDIEALRISKLAQVSVPISLLLTHAFIPTL